ncbi:hypothetical protein GN316_05035 [Xylophilus sp. Kf1]|nr:hypothetical protein [Xylophilus sp. Kf1]
MQATIWEAFLYVAPFAIVGATILLITGTKKRRRRAAAHRAHKPVLLSTVPIGKELGERTAELLRQGLQLCFRHRDYCGMGLRECNGIFVYGALQDGHLLAPAEWQQSLAAYPQHQDERTEFPTAELFILWLSRQSDASLAGDGNQRLTRSRILKAHDFCRNHPPGRWADYAG